MFFWFLGAFTPKSTSPQLGGGRVLGEELALLARFPSFRVTYGEARAESVSAAGSEAGTPRGVGKEKHTFDRAYFTGSKGEGEAVAGQSEQHRPHKACNAGENVVSAEVAHFCH